MTSYREWCELKDFSLVNIPTKQNKRNLQRSSTPSSSPTLTKQDKRTKQLSILSATKSTRSATWPSRRIAQTERNAELSASLSLTNHSHYLPSADCVGYMDFPTLSRRYTSPLLTRRQTKIYQSQRTPSVHGVSRRVLTRPDTVDRPALPLLQT